MGSEQRIDVDIAEIDKLDSKGKTSHRRQDVDWLRTVTTYSVVFYHANRFFDYWPQDLLLAHEWDGGSQIRDAFESISVYMTMWNMPMLFFLAGMSLSMSLQRRTLGRLLRERVTRLLLPVATGVLFFVSTQTCLLQHVRKGVAFGQCLVHFFDGTLFTISWMWFPVVLFAVSVFHLPFFNLFALNRSSSKIIWAIDVALVVLVPIAFFHVGGPILGVCLVVFNLPLIILGVFHGRQPRREVLPPHHTTTRTERPWVVVCVFLVMILASVASVALPQNPPSVYSGSDSEALHARAVLIFFFDSFYVMGFFLHQYENVLSDVLRQLRHHVVLGLLLAVPFVGLLAPPTGYESGYAIPSITTYASQAPRFVYALDNWIMVLLLYVACRKYSPLITAHGFLRFVARAAMPVYVVHQLPQYALALLLAGSFPATSTLERWAIMQFGGLLGTHAIVWALDRTKVTRWLVCGKA